MGGKCPLEMLQMTCNSIGRESPKPNNSESKKRKISETTKSTNATNKKEDINQNFKNEKEESPVAKLAKLSPTAATERNYQSNSPKNNSGKAQQISTGTLPSQASTSRPKSNSSAEANQKSNRNVTSSNPKSTLTNTSPLLGSTSAAHLASLGVSGAPNSLLNPNLLQSAELDRYLRASASLYSASTLQHPALSAAAAACYPSTAGLIPGLLPMTSPYMPYFTGYPQAALGLTGMNALFPALQPSALHNLGNNSTAASVTSETPASGLSEPSMLTCDWAKCGKKFSNAEQLTEHLKDHVTSSGTATASSTAGTSSSAAASKTSPTLPNSPTAAPNAAQAANLLPRFSPYNITSYPRDLLNSRFVYS